MDVAINLRSANLAIPDGHGESMRNLSRALVTTNPGHMLDLLTDAPPRYDLPRDSRASLRVLRPFPLGNRWMRKLLGADPWYRARVCLHPRWPAWSVYVQSAHEPTPVLHGPRQLAIVLDVACMRPGAATHFDPETLAFLDHWTAENVHRARGLVAISGWVRDEVVRIYGVRPDLISVAPLGVDRHRFRPDHDRADIEGCLARYGIAGPYLLFVGTLQPRKNLGTLTRAYLAARRQGLAHDLLIVGRQGWLYGDVAADIEGHGGEGVHLTGQVPAADLPRLVAGADAFVSVALDEGFGMPALEAMASGVPVVASDQAGLAFAVGDAGLLVDPCDQAAVTEALLRMAGDAKLREELRARGLARAAEFTWDRAARAVWEVVERVCESC